MIGPLVFAAAALTATAAHPHGASPNGGGFYAGALHPILALEHLLLLLAMGLLLGRESDGLARPPVVALAMALAAGLALGRAGLAWPTAPLGILAGAVLAGLGVAAGARPGDPAMALLAAVAGLATGLDAGLPPIAAVDVATWAPYAGLFVGTFLIVLNAMALASAASQPSYRIAVRVAGSWITAAAVMMLALHVQRNGVAA